MKRSLLPAIALLSLFVAACKEKPADLNSRLQTANSVVFEAWDAEGTPHPVTFSDNATVAMLRALPMGEPAPAMKCGDSGRLLYLADKDTVLAATVVLVESCHSLVYLWGDSLVSVWLAGAGDRFLDSMHQELAGPKGLSGFGWMLGQWTQEEEGAVSYESWTQEGENNFRGHSYTMVGKDTVFQERLELVREGKDVFYVATVSENAGPVRFRLMGNAEGKALFENKGHDFPQTIEYRAMGDSVLHARISGTQNGQFAAKDFPLKRVK